MMKEFKNIPVSVERDEENQKWIRALPYEPPSEQEFQATQAALFGDRLSQSNKMATSNPFKEIKKEAKRVKVIEFCYLIHCQA